MKIRLLLARCLTEFHFTVDIESFRAVWLNSVNATEPCATVIKSSAVRSSTWESKQQTLTNPALDGLSFNPAL